MWNTVGMSVWEGLWCMSLGFGLPSLIITTISTRMDQPTKDEVTPSEPFVPLVTPIKGRADWRSYRAFRLSNGVTCLAVHDKESKTTGMSCHVNVGAAADPRSLSGLAHFCEHMCFLGSEKYPGENEYKRFLSNHGGRSNASTSMHATNYKAEVLADHAETAFDIFSNFFIAPLFTLSGTAREVQAIDSENSKNLTADARRRLQILKALCDSNHYYSKFSTGNAKTIDTTARLEYVREALLAFHRKHYQPQHMTVVLAGPQSLDTLQEWIVQRFSQITVRDTTPGNSSTEIEQLIDQAAAEAPPNTLDEPPPPFSSPLDTSHNQLLTVKPLQSMRKLVLLWSIPTYRDPDTSPSSFLSHLLGHEGTGSIFGVLQNHGLLSRLTAGPRTKAPDFTLFQVDMELTAQGEEHWKQVVDTVFSYLRMLQQQSPSDLARIWDEMSRLDQLFFHQTSPGSVYDYAPNLADRIVNYGTRKALSAGSMLEESEQTFPLTQVMDLIQMLNPDNCLIERCSEQAWNELTQRNPDGLRREPWYNVEYHVSSIDSESVASWQGHQTMETPIDKSQLSLPRPNRYIPRSLELCSDLPEEAKQGPRLDKPIEPPTMLFEDDVGRLFHRLDDRYALPQSSLTLLIRNAAVQNVYQRGVGNGSWQYNDEAALLSSLLSGVLSAAMAQETYDADLAGLNWSLSLGSSGIKLSCFGFSDRLPDLALTILNEFLSGKFIQARHFDSTKDRVIRSLQTYFESRRADSHAVYYRDALLASKDNGVEESLNLAKKAVLEDLQRHLATLLANKEIQLECLFSGNVSSKDALAFYESAVQRIRTAHGLQVTEKLPTTVVPVGLIERRVNPGEDVELHFASKNPQEENGAVICSYQSSIPAFKGDDISHPLGLQSTAAIRLISHMLREPLFDDLRTKQQLGYVVSAYYELGYSSRPNDELVTLGPLTQPVDFITVAILSRKLSPPDIVKRIDEFMVTFRESLVTMPESEIRDHADALCTKLLKPIPKLQTEASTHFSKIQHYGPEIFYRISSLNPANGKSLSNSQQQEPQLPWDTVPSLATTLRGLTRQDLLDTWDRMTHPSTRSRIVSCVYGNTFPLITDCETKAPSPSLWGRRKLVVVDNFHKIIQLRSKLSIFDETHTSSPRRPLVKWISKLPSNHPQLWTTVGVGCVLGAGLVGVSLALWNQRRPITKR